MMTRNNNVGKFNIILSTLDELVSPDANVRKYDTAIDWTFIYPLVEDLYSKVGKPSIDPIVLFKMIFLNYVEGFIVLERLAKDAKQILIIDGS